MKIKIIYYLILIITLTLSACKKEDATEPILSDTGLFVVNEGSFGSSNGELTFWNISKGTVSQNIFNGVNGIPLGDIVQSMTIVGDRAYIVVNNSQKIEVVDKSTFNSIATINGFLSPRYFLSDGNGKGYVSDWTSNSIKVVDLGSNSITQSIPVGRGPEQMQLHNGKLYVVNAGGFGNDSTLSVISTSSSNVDTSIVVGLNPNSIVLDKNNKLWILCGGTIGPDWTPGTADDIAGKLIRIDPLNNFIESVFNFASSDHPIKLTTNGTKDRLYFLYGSSSYTGTVRSMDISDNSLPGSSLISRDCYGLGINPESGQIFCGISPSFNQQGYALRFNSSGALIDSVSAGIGPNGFCFK
ncbi:MAG TPA: hypothetical protein PKH65_01135 [Bacteroidia bacterium]|nr:hypothetical protein [Bacteroidia bacterium]HNT79257.1 hypothetical protein [Bacteroidia bacterium]